MRPSVRSRLAPPKFWPCRPQAPHRGDRMTRMIKTIIACRGMRRAIRGLLTAGALFLFATGAHGQVNQCTSGKINSQECWVGLQVSGGSVTVTPSDVALYSDTKLSWKRTDTPNPPDKPDFAVDFDSNDCTPFRGVFHFDQSTPAPIADELPATQFKRCKYKVTIGILSVDPQVIVVGGPKRHSQAWGRRHLGEW
jgi:hypothetical protein